MQRLVRSARACFRASRLGLAATIVNQPQAVALLYGGSDKRSHGYLPYYKRHLGPRRFRKNTIIEIGVGAPKHDYSSPPPGGSLFLWRDYFPRSTIVGVDIHQKHVRLGNRVSFVRADQSSPRDLRTVLDHVRRPDIVIDDGSHIGEHVVTSFRFLFPRLAAGGVYVIEDLHCSYFPSYGGGSPPPPMTGIGLLQRLSSDVQALDTVFAHASGPVPSLGSEDLAVTAVHVYPGIAFVEKANDS